MKNKFYQILQNQAQIDDFLKNPQALFTGLEEQPLLIWHERPGEIICRLLDMAEVINAAGGIVTNERGEILMIYRKGFWDLPKGKLELSETPEQGAAREVEEETGVTVSEVSHPSRVTYHAYILDDKPHIKHTDWFMMRAAPGSHPLNAQSSEGITDVRWVKPADLPEILPLAYPMIADILRVLHGT
ncbi:MAG: NUDIX domain-containing protein [Chitinophagales bacterium]|nr:NUDIX domain-containing protein [Chitinophagales bacterium]MDW8418204.1 NUDIX domain-containing protein [Chitinophagales bacterium]